MKKIFFCILILVFPYISHANTFTKTQIWGVELQYVTYDIASDLYNIKVAVSENAVSVQELASQNNGITAINGVFFCPADYRQCNGQNYTINERFVEGNDLSFYKKDTWERGVFGWNADGEPFIHQTGRINQNFRWHIYEWLWNFPILYSNGINMLERYHEVGLYDSKMSASLGRHFVCSNKQKTQIIFGRTWPTSLDSLAPVLLEIWCWDALNLDAGNSSQFLYNNRKLVSWKRNILDGFVIERVWLDTSLLDARLDKVMKIITPEYKRYSSKIAVSRLNILIDHIGFIRNDMYEKRSIDLYDANGDVNWYQIQADDIPSLERLYLINGLERRLRELRYSL